MVYCVLTLSTAIVEFLKFFVFGENCLKSEPAAGREEKGPWSVVRGLGKKKNVEGELMSDNFSANNMTWVDVYYVVHFKFTFVNN